MIFTKIHVPMAGVDRLWDPILAPSEAPPGQIIWVSIRCYFAKKVSKTIYWFIQINAEVQHKIFFTSRVTT